MRLLFVCMTALLLNSCGFSEKMDVMFECVSPSGNKVATFYRVSTGDRPGDTEMKMNIRLSDTAFRESMHSFSFKHGYDAIIHWDSDQLMRVEYPEYAELTHQETVIFGTSQSFNDRDQIRVLYQEQPSTHGYFVIEQRCFR